MATDLKTRMIQAVRYPLDNVPYLRITLSRLLPRPVTVYFTNRLMSGRSDRIYLERSLLSYLASRRNCRLLFVGCRSYTRHYGRLFADGGAEFWTTDIDPECEQWGEPGRHVVCDVVDIDKHFEPEFFDFIILNGIFGFGVDNSKARNATGLAIRKIMKRGGTFIVGWSPNPPDQDPDKVDTIRAQFEPGTPLELSSKIVVSGSDHMYSCYTAM